MPDEDLAGAEGVPVRASRRRVGDPLPRSGLHQLAQHCPSLCRSTLDPVDVSRSSRIVTAITTAMITRETPTMRTA